MTLLNYPPSLTLLKKEYNEEGCNPHHDEKGAVQMKRQVVNNRIIAKKGGITMKETTNAMINGMQGELNQLTWHGGRQGDLDSGTWHGGRQGDLDSGTWHGARQGDLDSGTWHGGRQGDLDSGTWHGGRQGDLDGGTWHSYEANDTAARSRDGPLT